MKTVYETVVGNPIQNRGWVRVNPTIPCPICGHTDWCTITEDGFGVTCMRNAQCKLGCAQCTIAPHKTANGGYWHVLDRAANPHSLRDTVIRRAEPMVAPIENRHAVYTTFGQELGLSAQHREHLLHVRGIPVDMLEGFASLPTLHDPRLTSAIDMTLLEHGKLAYVGIPGFYPSSEGWECAVSGPGILIPIWDRFHRIQGYQLRRDDPVREGTQKYAWFSSGHITGGIKAQPNIAVWNAPRFVYTGQVWLTEGPLKAASAAYCIQAAVLGIPGVSAWAQIRTVIPPRATAILAYDRDMRDNPFVQNAQDELAAALLELGCTVQIASWPSGPNGPNSYAYKGIDDYTLSTRCPNFVFQEWTKVIQCHMST